MKFGLQRAHQGRTRFRFQSACRRANQARQAEWLLLALLCQDCSMLASISEQARYTSKLALCTASDCRETSWQFQLPWEIRSGSSRAHRAKQSTQREGKLTMLLACLQKSTWTSCKVIPCILQHKQPHRSCSGAWVQHGLAQAMGTRARAGDGAGEGLSVTSLGKLESTLNKAHIGSVN